MERLNVREIIARNGFMAALLCPAIFLLITNENFRSLQNLSNVLAQSSIVGVVAIGMTIVMIAGGFDLSVGATAALSGMVAVVVFGHGAPLFMALGVAAAIGCGIFVGLVNGILVSRMQINPLIATLAMASIVRGIVLIASEGTIYRAQGDVPRHMFWQGLLSSLQLEPEWVRKYGASVDNYTDDMMPEAVARIAIMKLPPEERQQYLRSDGWPRRTALEKFTRLAFFDFLRNDPKFVAHTFFIDKPARAWRSEQQFFGGLFSGLPIWNALIPAVAVLFLAVLVAWNADALLTLLPTAGVIPFFIIVAWLPNWLVLQNPLVMIDNFVWIVVFLVLSLVIAATAAVRCLRYRQHPGNP